MRELQYGLGMILHHSEEVVYCLSKTRIEDKSTEDDWWRRLAIDCTFVLRRFVRGAVSAKEAINSRTSPSVTERQMRRSTQPESFNVLQWCATSSTSDTRGGIDSILRCLSYHNHHTTLNTTHSCHTDIRQQKLRNGFQKIARWSLAIGRTSTFVISETAQSMSPYRFGQFIRHKSSWILRATPLTLP